MVSNPRYICHCFDIMENLAACRNYTRLVINRDLTVGDNKHDNLGVRGSRYYYILGSIDSKQMVKNICTSQKYISWSYFFKLLQKTKAEILEPKLFNND